MIKHWIRDPTTERNMSTIAEEYRSLSRQLPTNPDIQATLSDFLTYTEHFPSHLTRALTLIKTETRRAEQEIAAIHADTTTYGLLPALPEAQKKNPVILRRNISYALEEAERAGRMRLEEATRLAETATREKGRLGLLVERLKAQPMPPSRDPTPEGGAALTSPNLGREGRLGGDTRSDKAGRRLQDKAASKLRARKVMVPGEVLPPPDPNAPPESSSDWTSPRASPPVEEPPLAATLKATTTTPRPRSRTPRAPKYERTDRAERDGKTPRSRGPRPSGLPGTNAHSAVAGISTSNALLALNPPPEGAPKGSKWLPWMKLTEWEMAKLRKRMKKNAIWVPSATMVRRELKNLGRGVAGREAARADARAEGGQLVDEGGEKDPTKVMLMTGEEQAMLGTSAPVFLEENEDADAELINRGMRLNEAKKLKRARMLEEQREAAAQIAREQAIDLPSVADAAIGEGTQKKRKRDLTPAMNDDLSGLLGTPDPLSKPGPAPKRLKLTAPTAASNPTTSSNAGPGASKVPLAPAGRASSPKTTTRASERRKAATPPPSAGGQRRPTLVLKAGKAVSEEPPNRRASLRRGSAGSLPSGRASLASPGGKGATRRSKRPAPGVITGGDDESAKVSASRRKAAPRKRSAPAGHQAKQPATATAAAAAAAPEPQPEEELIDPNEPRYCVCGDVSWGTMIACDNEDNCEKEWFHLSCVGLEDLPPRRTKWFCPDCRKKLKMGQGTNGLVGRVGGAAGAGGGR